MNENNENEKMSVTGLETATNRKDAEYDLVSALLQSAEFKTDDDSIHEVEIKRAGKFLFTVHLHPIGDPDARTARKKATTYAPHPNGKKYGLTEKDFNNAKFGSWLIYLSTTEKDQQTIWGNAAIMQKYNLMEPYESVDVLLTMGEKRKLLDLVTKISGMDDDEDEEVVDEESFQ